MANLVELNSSFALAEKITFSEGQGGPLVKLKHPDLGEAVVSVYGGHVLRYKPTGQDEDVLFVSEQAIYRSGTAIRGGIPVCWPWFGPCPSDSSKPSHGIARTRMFEVRSTSEDPSGTLVVEVGLCASDETRAVWDHEFDLIIRVELGTTLKTTLKTTNKGATPFSITTGLHTYFTISEIESISVTGLDGASYIDKVDSMSEKQQSGSITFTEEVDRIYNSDAACEIHDEGLNRIITIAKSGSQSTVVWNPWIDKSAGMTDLGNEDYHKFVCVETTNCGNDIVQIDAGETAEVYTDISCRPLLA